MEFYFENLGNTLLKSCTHSKLLRVYTAQVVYKLQSQVACHQKKKYRGSAKRLHQLVANFDANDILEYLRGIAYNLSF